MKVNYLKESAAAILKKRFLHERNQLPKSGSLNDFIAFVQAEERQYNCPEGFTQIRSVWYGAKADVRLTELIKEYAITLANIQLDQY